MSAFRSFAPLAPLRAAVRPGPSRLAIARFARPYSAEAEAAPADESAKKLAECEEKVKELNKELQYARADYQTLSRRSAEEKARASDFAISSFARSLLSTVDVLSAALSHVPQPVAPATPLAELFSGVELTQKALLKTLEQHGVTRFRPDGEPFDPNLHEASFQIPAEVAPKRADGKQREKGEIVEVGKEGWMIKGRVLRPAQVGVVMME
ncbi:GrpE, mitochondrial [Cryptotrichosporon argae]